MKTTILILLCMLLSIKSYAPGLARPILRNDFRPHIFVIHESKKVVGEDKILLAHMDYESKSDPLAHNKATDAAGILQICPIGIEEVNRILTLKGDTLRFTLSDRYDVEKSKKIWYIIQHHRNPSYNPVLAARIWNSGTTKQLDSTDGYVKEILKRI